MMAEERNWFVWFKHRIAEAVLAVFVVFLIVQFKDQIDARQRDALPASAWFQVNEIFVPDFRVGENPEMIYDRTVREDFRGFFVVEVQQQQANGLWFAACSGSGASDYEQTDAIPDRTVEFSWFVNRDCNINPGTYRLRVSWDMRRVGWPTKTTVALSNIFEVTR